MTTDQNVSDSNPSGRATFENLIARIFIRRWQYCQIELTRSDNAGNVIETHQQKSNFKMWQEVVQPIA